MLEVSDKNFRATTITMLNNVKKNVLVMNGKMGNPAGK